MKKYLNLAVIIFFATIAASFAGPDKATIEAKVKAAFQAFKDKKADDFKKLIDKDLRSVYADGVSTREKELSDMQKWDMKSFTISAFDSFTDEPDVVVTSYKVAIEGTKDGKDMTGTYNCGDVWKKEKGAWLAIFHASSKEEAATK